MPHRYPAALRRQVIELARSGTKVAQLAKGKSLADIAEFLNRKGVPPAHGTNQWTAAMVRKAYVS